MLHGSRGGDLAPILTAEQGKPLADANIEVFAAAIWCQYFANLETPPRGHPGRRPRVSSRWCGGRWASSRPSPRGTSRWSLAFWKIAPALLAGNTMVLKPSPFTPLATLKMGELLRDVLPPGVLNVVSGGDDLGAWMTGHPVPRKISFTGSIATGKKVAAAGGPRPQAGHARTRRQRPGHRARRRRSGRRSPPKVFAGAFNNNGQVCSAIKRVYVPEAIYDDVVEALAAQARGDQGRRRHRGRVPSWARSTTSRSSSGCQELVADALSGGATRRHRRQGHGPSGLLLRADDSGRADATAPASSTRSSSAPPCR